MKRDNRVLNTLYMILSRQIYFNGEGAMQIIITIHNSGDYKMFLPSGLCLKEINF
jgi:hypothetical protein